MMPRQIGGEVAGDGDGNRRQVTAMSGDVPRQADFGFAEVPWQEKARRVRRVFDSVADRYDLMNDLMSGGTHRAWKRFALALTGLRPGQRALDVAAGTGDLARGLARQVGERGLVTVTDINAAMLRHGRDQLIDRGLVKNLVYVQADAEQLPFRDASFECVTIGFGLRNVTDKPAALASMYRVLKPGGQLLVLEFSQPALGAIGKLYDLYSFSVLPRLGRLVVGDADSYRYLAESIRRHPDQQTLLQMMQAAGFGSCRYHNLMGGIVALHRGYRY
jgi:demethylmenaquinone methyltransferase / 2-methoxy-6-polyprenyl-1,4-benzoquinol methylase